MVDIPDHLLQRSKERRKALGLPVPGEEGGEVTPEADAPEPVAPSADAPAAETPAAASAPAADVETASGTKIPAHLLERAARRRAAAGGGGDVAAAGATGAAAATATLPAPTSTGPGVTPSDCSPWSSRVRSNRPGPRRRTRCTPGRICSWSSSPRS